MVAGACSVASGLVYYARGKTGRTGGLAGTLPDACARRPAIAAQDASASSDRETPANGETLNGPNDLRPVPVLVLLPLLMLAGCSLAAAGPPPRR